MSRKRFEHLHVYKAINSDAKIYKCTVPGCVHSINRSLLQGRKAACPFCDKDFIITDEHLRRVRLHCLGCTSRGKPVEQLQLFDETKPITKADDVFMKLLKEKNL